MAKVNYGKRFEEDFKASAEKHMFVYRLRDPAASFNQEGNNLRFSWRNMCDFIGYSHPVAMLIECKSKKGSYIPFKEIITKESDHRLKTMVKESKKYHGLLAFVVFNWRDKKNKTMAVPANKVLSFIESCGSDFGLNRKSIPFDWTVEHGIEIESRLKKVRYGYETESFVGGFNCQEW